MINNINPTIINFGIINIRWYGLFLALGVALTIFILTKLAKKNNLSVNTILDLCVWLVIGGLIGARLGYIIFYQLNYYLANPAEIFFINHGGLSSHGLTIGLMISFLLFVKYKSPLERGVATSQSRRGVLPWQKIMNILVIPIPLLAAFIRLGNFFNSEIVGRATDLPWGVYFSRFEESPILRHPVQLYEVFFNLALFLILYSLFKKLANKKPKLFFFHLFLLLYFSGRFLIEFTKEYQVGWENFLTAGQWLSLPFILWGIIYFVKLKISKNTPKI